MKRITALAMAAVAMGGATVVAVPSASAAGCTAPMLRLANSTNGNPGSDTRLSTQEMKAIQATACSFGVAPKVSPKRVAFDQ